MSDPGPNHTEQASAARRRRKAEVRSGRGNDPQLQLRVTRRAEPDMRRLVGGEHDPGPVRRTAPGPDPYDLPPPDDLGPVSNACRQSRT